MRHTSTLLRSSARRRFLTLALGGTLLLALNACVFSSVPSDTPPPHADYLKVEVTSNLTKQTVFSITLSDATVISGVQSDLLTLLVVTPDVTINCPADVPDTYSYALRFTEQGSLAEQATSDATACGFWDITTSHGKVTRYGVSQDFWNRLQQLTSAPLPKNYY